MRSLLRSLPPLAAVAASLALAACGSSSSGGTTSSAASTTQPATTTSAGSSGAVTVKTASSPSFGTILVDSQGMTLYRLSGEQNGKFICTTSSGCLGVWHPLSVSAGATPTGVGSLGTVKRPEGTVQVTYKGEPLYTFAQDHQAGETGGQGIKDVGTWSVVKVGSGEAQSASGGTSSTPSSSSSSSSSSSGGSGGGGESGYGY